MFLSYLAALHNNIGNKEKAIDCLQKAKSMSCKDEISKILNRVIDEIYTTQP
jgi:hypothetical protein